MGKIKIVIGSDHAGYQCKEKMKEHLLNGDFEVEDIGPKTPDSVDYPDYAHPLAIIVENKKADVGILVCGSGNGMAMAANKHAGIRAALCWSEEIAKMARLHNDANILCVPARFIDFETITRMINIFLSTSFEGGRHQPRVNKISC